MKKSKIFAAVLVFALCCAMFAGCNKPAADPATDPGTTGETGGETIKVGFVGPKTGEVSQYGLAVESGVKMYIDEINAAGGVLGKQVELISYDEKGDAVEAISAFNRLVEQDKVVAIFGSVTSNPTLAVAEASAAMDNPIPMITASATAEDVTSYGDNMFRTCFLDPFQGETMARYAKEVLGAATAAVIYNNAEDYCVGLNDSFAATCAELGIEMVAQESYTGGEVVDFKAQLTNITAKNPDVLFVPNYYEQDALIAAQARDLGYEGAMLGCDGWDGILKNISDPSILENCYFSNHYSSGDPDPMIQGFLANYKALYGEDPMSFAATAYDAAKVMFDAIERAGSTDSAAIIAALKETDLACVTGQIVFDEKNNPIKTCAIVTFENGEYKFDQKF